MKHRRFLQSALLLGSILLSTSQMLAGSVPVYAEESSRPSADEIVLNASDFGADPSGIQDSTQAVIDLLERAREVRKETGKPVRVEFEKGEYQIYKDKASKRVIHTSNTNSSNYPEKTIGLLIENQQDLTIDGHGALFMMHGNIMALCVSHSSNITLKNFSWDFAVPTTSEMTITAFEQEESRQATVFYIPKCFPYDIQGTTIRWHSELSPYTGNEYWSQTGIHNAYSITAHDPSMELTRRYNTSTDSPFRNVTAITPVEGSDGTLVRFVYNGSRPAMQKLGMTFELNSSAVRETAGAMIWESEDVHVENVNVHYMHGFGFLLQMSKDIYFNGCSIKPRENSGHITSSYADGIHASGVAGNLVVENCEFIGLHDDPINFHGTFTRAEQVIDSHTMELRYIHQQQGGFPQYHVGDKVQFFTRDTLESSDLEKEYTVAEVISDPGENGNDIKTMVIRFEEELPDYLSDTIGSEPKYVAENVTYTPNVTIRGNLFRDLAARAILCTTRGKVLIEDNEFFNTSMSTIYLSNDSNNWYESGPIRDMTIRNNTFHIKDSLEQEWEYCSAIYVHPVTKGGGLPSWENPVHKNITVEGNTFYMDADTVIKAESVENLLVRNNKILRENPDIAFSSLPENLTLKAGEKRSLSIQVSGSQRTAQNENITELTKCKNVVFENNIYDDGQKLYAVYSGMPAEQIHLNNDPLTRVTDRNQPAAPGAGKVYAVSLDPQTASIQADGSILGLNPGATEIIFYTITQNAVFESERVSVTVTEQELNESRPSIQTPETLHLNDGETLQLKKDTGSESAVWSVSLPDGSSAQDQASITEDGLFSFAQSGVYRVSLTSSGGEDSILIACSAKSALRSPQLSVRNEQSARLSMTKNQADLTLHTGDLYQNNNSVENLTQISIPETMNRNSLRTVIHVTNLPVKESGQWDTGSFFLFKDPDNYVSIGKKSHYDGIASVREVSGTAEELGGNAEENSVTEAWLGFTVQNNTVSLDYKTGESWQHLRNLDASMLSDQYSIAFGGWHTNDRSKHITFSDLKISDTAESYDELMEEESVPFILDSHADPVITHVTLNEDEETPGKYHASFDAQYSDGTAQKNVWYLFTLENEKGKETTLSTSPDFISRSGTLSCTVYLSDSSSQSAIPVTSAPVTVSDKQQDRILGVSIGNVTLDPDTENLQKVLLPASARKAELHLELSGSLTVTINGRQESGSDQIIELTGDSTTISIKYGNQTRELEIIRSKDTESKISSLTVDGVPVQEGQILTASSNQASLVLESNASSSMKIVRDTGFAPVDEQPEASHHESTLKLTNGMNNFRIDCISQDGLHKDSRLVSILYVPDSSCSLHSIVMDGGELDLNKPTATLPSSSDRCHMEAEASARSKVQWFINGTIYEGTTVDFENLSPGFNTITLTVTAEDGISKVSKTILVHRLEQSDCAIRQLCVDGKILDPSIEHHVKATDQNQAEITVEAFDPLAMVFICGKAGSAAGRGVASLQTSLYEDAKSVTVTVISKDGQKSIVRQIEFEKAAYLSDLNWLPSSVTGWGSIKKDKSAADQSLKLLNGQKEEIIFDKGLGLHADADAAFDLPADTYVSLEGYVGVDANKKNSTYANVDFEITGNGSSLFTSSTMTGSSAMEHFKISLDGITSLHLKASQSSNSNWDAHADFALLRLEMKLPQSSKGDLNTASLLSEMNTVEGIDFEKADPAALMVWIEALNEGGACLAQANSGSAEISQGRLDQCALAVRLAREALLHQAASLDTTLLEMTISHAERLILTEYPQDQIAELQSALADAELALTQRISQQTINEAASSLNQVLLGMRKKPDPQLIEML